MPCCVAVYIGSHHSGLNEGSLHAVQGAEASVALFQDRFCKFLYPISLFCWLLHEFIRDYRSSVGQLDIDFCARQFLSCSQIAFDHSRSKRLTNLIEIFLDLPFRYKIIFHPSISADLDRVVRRRDLPERELRPGRGCCVRSGHRDLPVPVA